MGLFGRKKTIAGWMAINFLDDGVCVACIKRQPASAPEVGLVAFYPASGAELAAPPEKLTLVAIHPSSRAELSQPLEKLSKELRADRYSCSTLLASGEYQILSVDAPNVPPAELKTAIRWRLKDMLDYHIDDAMIDVLDIPPEKNAPVRNHSMHAVAARNQVIEQRVALFGQAKIPLSVIDIPEMAQRNISALLEPEGRGVALVSFDSEGGLLTVTCAGELYLSRRIDVKLPQLTQSDADERNACFGRVALELQRSLDHLDRQYHFIRLARLVLSPLGESGAGLREYLAANLYMQVDALDLETVLDITRVPELKSPEAQQRYFMALGAALRLEEKVL
jgi:MSHA biogenesis protein MshI